VWLRLFSWRNSVQKISKYLTESQEPKQYDATYSNTQWNKHGGYGERIIEDSHSTDGARGYTAHILWRTTITHHTNISYWYFFSCKGQGFSLLEEMGKYEGETENIKIEGWSKENVKRRLETENSEWSIAEEDFAVPAIYSENGDERHGQYRLLSSPTKAAFLSD